MPEGKIVGPGGDFAQAPESHHCAGADLSFFTSWLV